MSTRKFESGYSKIQKKRRIEALVASQQGAMNKVIKIDKKNELKNINCLKMITQIILLIIKLL